MPDRQWQDWPLVVMNGDHSCSTIGPNAKSMIEFINFDSNAPQFDLVDYYNRIACEFYETTLPLAKHLGNEVGVRFFNDFMADIKEKNEEITEERSDRLIVDFWTHFDTSDEHLFLRNVIKMMAEDAEYLPEIFTKKNYGIWQTRLCHLLMSRIDLEAIEAHPVSSQLIIECFNEPHCYDPEYFTPKQKSSSTATDPTSNVNDFIRTIMSCNLFQQDDDPVYYVIKKIHEQGRRKYTGIPHVEFAAFADEFCNNPLLSWNALVNAAYWSGQNLTSSMLPARDAAIALCARNGWTDAMYALEYQAAIY